MIKTYEENVKVWEGIIENIEHPQHRIILNRFHSDMFQDILYHIEEGTVNADFESIMQAAMNFLLFNLSVQIRQNESYDYMELLFGQDAVKQVESIMNRNEVEFKYEIDNFFDIEECKSIMTEMESDGYDPNELETYLDIKAVFNEKHIALLKLTKSMRTLGELAYDYLDTEGTYINGEHYDNFDEE